jgi:hypothetical protein
MAKAEGRLEGIAEGKALGRAEGEQAVLTNPAAHDLVTKDAYDLMLADANSSALAATRKARTEGVEEGNASGIAFVKANSNTHGLYAEVDLNASKVMAKAEGRLEGIAEGKALGRAEGEQAVLTNPAAHDLVTKDAYGLMVEQFINASSNTATPYTDGWFFYPNRGWMFTNRTAYPYFYDSFTQSWMYFKSGEDKPRFYDYGSKTWVTIE